MAILISSIESIKDNLDIKEVAKDFGLSVKRNNATKCIFHNDNNPSMYFKDKFFKCFSCGKSGDVFELIKQIRNCSFREAAEILSARYGIVLEFSDENQEEYSELKRKKDDFDAVMQKLCNKFQESLISFRNRDALSYIESRGLGAKEISDFRLGFSDDAKTIDTISDRFQESSIDLKKELGCSPVAYNNRISIPIIDKLNRIVGFSFRQLKNDGSAKYINTASSQYFNKRTCFFGENFAVKAIKSSYTAILVEGQFDAIALQSKGIKNAVAVQGTSFSCDHVRHLKSLGAKKVIIFFDGDRAGVEASIRVSEECFKEGVVPYIFPTPEGKDPSSIILEDKKSVTIGYLQLESLKAKDVILNKMKIDEFNKQSIKDTLEYKSVTQILDKNVTLELDVDFVSALNSKASELNITSFVYAPEIKKDAKKSSISINNDSTFFITMKSMLSLNKEQLDKIKLRNNLEVMFNTKEKNIIWDFTINKIINEGVCCESDLISIVSEKHENIEDLEFIISEIGKVNLDDWMEHYDSMEDIFNSMFISCSVIPKYRN